MAKITSLCIFIIAASLTAHLLCGPGLWLQEKGVKGKGETVPLDSSVQLHSNISPKPEIQAGSLESHRTLTINPIIRNYMDEILAKSLRMVSQTGAFRATLYFNNNTTAVDTNVDMRRPSDAFLRGVDGGGAMQKVRVTVTSSTQVALSWSSSVAL